MAHPDITPLCDLIASHRYNIQDEESLQDGIERVLRGGGYSFIREATLDELNRPDFLLQTLALEVKTKDSFAKFMRQARKYLKKPEIEALLVVGTCRWLPQVPPELAGKPIYVLRLTASIL